MDTTRKTILMSIRMNIIMRNTIMGIRTNIIMRIIIMRNTIMSIRTSTGTLPMCMR